MSSHFICLKCAEKITWEHEVLCVGCLGKRYCEACSTLVDIKNVKPRKDGLIDSRYEVIRKKDYDKLLDVLTEEFKTEYENGCYKEEEESIVKEVHKRLPGLKERMQYEIEMQKRKEMLDNLHKALNLKEGEELIVKEILALPKILPSLKKKMKHE